MDFASYILCEIILNTFLCVEVRIDEEKLNLYEGYIFPGHYYKHADWKRLSCV